MEYIITFFGMGLLTCSVIFWVKFAFFLFSVSQYVWNNPPWENWIPSQYPILAIISGIIGVIFISGGIFKVKPRYLWIGLLIIGSTNFITSLTANLYFVLKKPDTGIVEAFSLLLICLLPGIVSIVEALVVSRLPGRHEKDTFT